MNAHDRLSTLERSGRFEEAAMLAERLGDASRAARAWQGACAFDRAAKQWLRAGRADRALVDAARAAHAELIETCMIALLNEPDRARATARRLEKIGSTLVAARLLETLGEDTTAAKLYEDSHHHFEAARVFHHLRQSERALTNLLTATRKQPANGLARLALATLYERRDQNVEAIRWLQRVESSDALYPVARHKLAELFERLGLPGVSAVVRSDLDQQALVDPELIRPLADFESLVAASDEHQGLLLGRYEIVSRVTSTATAAVYQAFDRVVGRIVAVKLFSPSLISGSGRDAFFRFEREVQLLRAIAHPTVVPALEYHAEGPALVLQWMSGGSFREQLETTNISPRKAALAVSRVLAALGEAHRRGILHRDIKPDNILYDAAGLPYLSDFGTAHVADHARTVTQGMIGTLAYMAPEQRQGRPANVRSDIYSAGAVFWHALTGSPPGLGHDTLPANLSESQRALATRLIDPPAIPETAALARALIDGEAWPSTPAPIIEAPPQKHEPPGAPSARGQRLLRNEAASFDQVLEREVEVLKDPASLARAKRFAAADHPALNAVLALKAPDEMWLEHLPTTPGRPLEKEHRARLAAALRSLHESGGYHGRVNREHLAWRGSMPVLRFPLQTAPATLDQDLANLDQLDE